jgi:hypothetical protein
MTLPYRSRRPFQLQRHRSPHSSRRFPRLRCLVNILATASIVTAFIPSARAQASVELAWDASTDPAVAGYRLYEGAASRVYTNTMDVGKATIGTVSNLVGGVTYYFAVTDYDTNGLESDYSSEVAYTVPLPTNGAPIITLSRVVSGGSVTLDATGPQGQSYSVLRSPDLHTWTVIGSLTLNSSGSGQFTDPKKNTGGRFFYRLRQP